MLADLVEKLKKTGLQETVTPSDQSSAEPGDVECDVCTGRKNKAVRSCLVCMASYCGVHVQPHYDSAAFKKHKLVSASGKLQETICPRHDKLLDVYCRTDRQCICYLCLTDEHKGHDAVLAEAEIQQKQSQLDEMKQNCLLRIQQRDNEIRELKRAIFSITRSARAAVEESDSIFTELIRCIELKRFEMRELILAQEKTAVSQAEEQLEKIQKEIAELKMNEAELEKIFQAEDHIHFLQSVQALPDPPTAAAIPTLAIDPNLTFGPVMTAVSEFKGLLQEVCQGGFVGIYEKVRNVVIIGSPNPDVPPATTQASDAKSTVQVELTQAIPTPGLNQNLVNPFNPFLTPGPPVPSFGGFILSPCGSRLSSGSRLSFLNKRAARRKK
ncbi:hypothetical protein LDENG_00246780 [Lucifuga dentata]|nr:hypothetical protein LDENG_00246780 [Lucifuga dentata]